MEFARYRLRRTKRLSGRKAFARVFAARCSAADKLMLVYAARNDLPYCRIGLSVGRKIGAAVRRNRVKRLFREAFRLEQNDLPRGCDYVVVPRECNSPSLSEYRRALRSAASRAATRANKTGDP